MHVSRRQLLTGAAALATAGGLRARRASAQAPTPAAMPRKGGQIIVGITQEPQNFNPVMPTIETQRGVHMAIFDDLWRRDGTLFTVKLRPGVTWHDGQPFTARDVMFTWKTIMNPAVTAFSTVGFDQIADMWAYNPKIKGRHRYDPQRAKTLL